MGPIEYYTAEEMQEMTYKLGDIIQNVEFASKALPDEYRTAYLMLRTAHSMFVDAEEAGTQVVTGECIA